MNCIPDRFCILEEKKPYVAVHCWKAISLRIVRCPSKTIFIKGPVYKLHIKYSAFTTQIIINVTNIRKPVNTFPKLHSQFSEITTKGHMNAFLCWGCKNII